MKILFFLIALFLPLSAFAQSCGNQDLLLDISAEDRARLDALIAPHPYPEGIAFHAEKPGSQVTVVGTIHIPDPRLAQIIFALEPRVAAADLLILEATSEDQAALQGMANTKPDLFFLNEGPTLIDLLSEEEWQQITDRLSALGLPGFVAAKFKPWYLSLTLAIPPCIMTEMLAGLEGLDMQLESIATEAEVPIAALDDLDSLLEILAGDPLDVQLDTLRMSLEMMGDGDAMTTTLIERYFQGKIRETWEYGRISLEDSGLPNAGQLFQDMEDALLINRNVAWEPKIAELVEGKTTVIAVGAAHLSGEDGVLRALERAGFSIVQIPIEIE